MRSLILFLILLSGFCKTPIYSEHPKEYTNKHLKSCDPPTVGSPGPPGPTGPSQQIGTTGPEV